MQKRRFRKVYFIAEDNQLFRGNYTFVSVFRDEAHAKQQEVFKNKRAVEESTMIFNQGVKPIIYKAEGFYLVHESLFDEILKSYADEEHK